MRRVAGGLFLWLAACRGSALPPAPDAAPAPSTSSTVTLTDAAVPVADASTLADASVDAAVLASVADPFGVAKTTKAACAMLAEGKIAEADRTTSFVDGDDLLALVNRSPTGQLAPDYAPSDLVDIRSGKAQTAGECMQVQCLRKEAAAALDELLARMKTEGFPGKVESAFRSYGAQCGTFANWARKSTFCEATEQSALPGHSQHQLGTTVDLFTEEWAKDERGVFREGFGCTPAGRWIREHATEHGFVMPYPIHPDDRHPKNSCVARFDIPVNINPRTGYRYEHWHIRYVGKEAAVRFRTAYLASNLGKPGELTVEQWLRREKGITGPDAELPVCDQCSCGACATLAASSACDAKGGALHLDAHGKPVASATPTLASVAKARGKKWRGGVVEVKLDVPAGTVTQPPIVGLDGAGYEAGATYEKLAPYPATEPRAFPPLEGAWVVAVEPVPNDTGTAWPWRAAITTTVHGRIYDKANVLLPAHRGATTLRVPIPPGVTKARVVLLRGGVAVGASLEVGFSE